jgi:hypothetical protein
MTSPVRADRDPSPDDRSLAALLAACARRASDGALAGLAAGGLTASLAIGLLAPSWWRVLPILILAMAFGAWGIADRERSGSTGRQRFFAVIRGIALLVGAIAGILIAIAIMAPALGTWIS